MSAQDLTADMLTRIRNAVRNREKSVVVISNKLNRGVATVLKDEGYISDYENVADGRQGIVKRCLTELGGMFAIRRVDADAGLGCANGPHAVEVILCAFHFVNSLDFRKSSVPDRSRSDPIWDGVGADEFGLQFRTLEVCWMIWGSSAITKFRNRYRAPWHDRFAARPRHHPWSSVGVGR